MTPDTSLHARAPDLRSEPSVTHAHGAIFSWWNGRVLDRAGSSRPADSASAFGGLQLAGIGERRAAAGRPRRGDRLPIDAHRVVHAHDHQVAGTCLAEGRADRGHFVEDGLRGRGAGPTVGSRGPTPVSTVAAEAPAS